MAKGKFITFEGVDGAGKSTHLNWFAAALEARGIDLLVTREPGGTPLGEKLRELLLRDAMQAETEALLMFAARNEHLAQVIRPALQQGIWVISDRFTDASFAYQGGGRGMAIEKLAQLEQWVHADLQPDLTLLFDIPVEIARQRLTTDGNLDKFEQEQSDFFERVRQAYLARAAQNPTRYLIIQAEQSKEEVKEILSQVISTI